MAIGFRRCRPVDDPERPGKRRRQALAASRSPKTCKIARSITHTPECNVELVSINTLSRKVHDLSFKMRNRPVTSNIRNRVQLAVQTDDGI